jgi:hypothetical protein
MADKVVTVEINVKSDGLILATSKAFTGSSQLILSESIPDESTDLAINCAIDVSAFQLVVFGSTQDLTIEVNSGSVPDFTLALKANQPHIEMANQCFASLLTDDTVTLYVTNASGEAATLDVLALTDATPA